MVVKYQQDGVPFDGIGTSAIAQHAAALHRWARRSRWYWLPAAGIGEDVIGGRVSLVAGDGEGENFYRFARALARHSQRSPTR